MKIRATPCLTALLLWANLGVAADKLSFAPPDSWVRTASIPSSGTKTEAPIKILLLDRQLRFSGRTEELYAEDAVLVQSPQGLGSLGTVSLIWNPDTDVLTVHKVRLIRNDKIIDILAAGQTFTIARRETNLEYAALDGRLTAIIQPSGLQVGDIVDIAYTLKRSDPVMAGVSEDVVDGWANSPVSKVEVAAQWPTSEAIHWKNADGINGIQQERSGSVSSVHVGLSDVQPVIQPKFAPARFLLDPRIEFSSFASWAEVAAQFAPLYEHAAKISPKSPLQGEIARIASSSTDPKQRAALALSLVEDQVRYVFLGMNDGGFVPADVDLTWSRRFGDCKAKSVLLVAILRALGIDAEPVAVSTVAGDRVDAGLPMILRFNHVIVRATINGQVYWLDGTRLGDRAIDDLPVENYHWGLPLLARHSDLVKIAPNPPLKPLAETSVHIDATAGITSPAPFHVDLVTRGDVAMTQKLRFANLAENQLTDALRTYWSKIYPFVEVRSVSATYDERAGEERVTMDGTAKMDWSANRYETDGLAIGYQADFERTAGPNRDAPFAVAYPLYVRSTETIQLPNEGIGFSIQGDDINHTVAGSEYHRQASLNGAVFSGEATQRSLEPEFPASEAAAAQQALRDMARSTLYIYAPTGHPPSQSEVSMGMPATIDSANNYAARGGQRVMSGEPDAAIEDFNAALATDPNDASTIADRGIAYVAKGEIERGQSDVDKAMAIDPKNPVAFVGRGMLATKRGDNDAAISAYTTVLASAPNDIFALEMRAESYYLIRDYDKALVDVTKAINVAPQGGARRYLIRAMILQRQNHREEAIRQAQLAIEADPKSPDAYGIAGEIYAALQDNKQAMLAFSHAINIAPTEAAYFMRARVRPSTDVQGRLEDLKAAVNLNPESTRDLVLLAEVETEDGEYGDAVSHLSSAIKRNGETVDLLARRGVAYAKAKQTTLADQDLAAAQAKAEDPRALNSICWTLATAGVSMDIAMNACDGAIATGRGNELAHFLDSRGFLLLKLGRCKDAMASYEKALKLEPLLATALYGRGICELREGQKKEAQEDMKDGMDFSNSTVAADFVRYGVKP